MTKKFLEVEVGSLDIESTAVDAIKELKHYVEKYGDSTFLKKDWYPYGGSEYLAVFAKVLETDEQEEIREKQESLARTKQEADERAALARLKDKYEKS